MPSNPSTASAPASPRHATLIMLCALSVLPLSLFLPSLTGALLTPANAGYLPLAMMLLSAAIALAAAVCVRAFDGRDAAR
ncbi:hypothetical protein [Burkholderia sp. AU39826]|uniref:hypothetical protein n=1 Tax=Burkholderia sp. AU39826 TaxID=2879634 RepID=UPI0039A5CAD9